MISFVTPWVLAFLVLVPLLLLLTGFRRRPTLVVPESRNFAAASPRKRRWRVTAPEWCYLLALALLIVGLARPRFGDEKQILRANGIDIILALDISGSMEAVDISDMSREELENALQKGELQTRLAVAKKELAAFVNKRPNDRIGLIVFGEKPYNAVPPTLDHAFLLEQLKRFQIVDMISNRTGLAAPIGSGVRRLRSSKAPRRVLVLFTDGRNNVNARLSPVQAAKLAKDSHVIVHTVGIGGKQAICQDRFGRWQPIASEFDEAMLKEIAQTAEGRYFHAGDAQAMKEVMRDIDALEKTSEEQPKYIEYREYASVFALGALLLLCAGLILQSSFCRRLP